MAVVVVLLYLGTGRHIVPYWPEARGVPWEPLCVAVHCLVIVYGGSLYLVGYLAHNPTCARNKARSTLSSSTKKGIYHTLVGSVLMCHC